MTHRRDEPGHGRRRPRQHRAPAPVGRAARARSSSARRPTARRARRSPSRRPASRRSRARRARSRPGGRSASSPSAAAANRSEALEAPFVGRDDELRLLKDLFHATSREQRARLVSVIGPAGIGKSRLAWEFLKYVDGLAETIWWHHGRPPPTARASRSGRSARWSASAPASPRPTTRRRPGAAGREAGRRARPRRGGAALDRAGPRSLAARRRTTAPAGGREELFAAWRTFFERIAAHGHGRAGLRGPPLGRHRPARLHRPPARVVARACRSSSSPSPGRSSSSGGPTGAPGKRNFTSSQPRAARRRRRCASSWPASCRACPSTPSARSSRAPTASRCTPSRPSGCSLAEGRLARARTARIGRSATSTSLAVPETLHGAHRGPPRRARPGRPVAAPGRRRPRPELHARPALAAVTGLDQAELEPRAADARPPRAAHRRDRSALARSAASTRSSRRSSARSPTTRSRRRTGRARHLAAARYFEALGEDELAGRARGTLPRRLSRTRPRVPRRTPSPARRGSPSRAPPTGRPRSARTARRSGSSARRSRSATTRRNGSRFCERAANRPQSTTPVRGERRLLEETIAWHRAHDDLRSVARATALLGSTLIGLSQPIAAAKVIEAGEAETDTLVDDDPSVVRLLTELSRAYAIAGDPRATATADRALEAAERLDLVPSIAEALVNRALALGFTGHHDETVALLRGTLVLAEANGLGSTRLRAINNLSATLEDDDPREALVVSERGVELARRLGDRRWLTFLLLGMTGQYIGVGDMEQAQRNLAEFEGVDLSVPVQVALAEALATVRAMHGEISGAEEAMAAVEPLRASIDDPRVEGWRLSTTAIVDLMAGRLEDAYAHGIACARRGEDGAEMGAELAGMAALSLGDAPRARVALDLHRARNERGALKAAARLRLEAGCRALEGDRAGAFTAFRSAISVYRDLDLPMQLGFTLLDFALIGRPDRSEATAAVDEARAIFTRAGWLPLLARLEAGVAEATADTPARTATPPTRKVRPWSRPPADALVGVARSGSSRSRSSRDGCMVVRAVSATRALTAWRSRPWAVLSTTRARCMVTRSVTVASSSGAASDQGSISERGPGLLALGQRGASMDPPRRSRRSAEAEDRAPEMTQDGPRRLRPRLVIRSASMHRTRAHAPDPSPCNRSRTTHGRSPPPCASQFDRRQPTGPRSPPVARRSPAGSAMGRGPSAPRPSRRGSVRPSRTPS